MAKARVLGLRLGAEWSPTRRIMMKMRLILCIAVGVLGYCTRLPAAAESQETFKERAHSHFQAETGQPLNRAAKRPPLRKGSGNFTRAYSYSIVNFAARCFYLNEQIDEANAALVENAQHYLDHPLDIIDRDSFHWHADIVMRLISMYGKEGTARAGLLKPETEEICLKPIWIYVEKSSKYNQPDHAETKTWAFHSTENHHAMDLFVQWHFAKLARNRPEYGDFRVGNGMSLQRYYEEWNDYLVVYCRERAKKGVAIEIMCPGYNMVWLKGLYNAHDFGEPRVKNSVTLFLDLYWAYWAQEQLNGVEGGGKTRIRGVNAFRHNSHGIPAMGWFYFGIGEKPNASGGEINALLSDYAPPAVVSEIAHSARADGPYEIVQRAQGLGANGVGEAVLSDNIKPNTFRTDGGGIIRYSYCDPAFTIGCLMTEARPNQDWVAISSQSRWQGVVFSDHLNARIVPTVVPAGEARDVLNAFWSVQSKGSLITQKLKDSARGGSMVVWMSKEGLQKPTREGDLVFVETNGAYSVIRVVGSDFDLKSEVLTRDNVDGSTREAPPGWVVTSKDDFAPIILEVMAKNQISDFAAFKEKAAAAKLTMDGAVLHYTSIYGDKITFDTQQKEIPAINDKPVDYTPRKVLESPFLNADYDRAVITIQKGKQSTVLDFNK